MRDSDDMQAADAGRLPTRPWPDPEWDRVSPWPPARPVRQIRAVGKTVIASCLLVSCGAIFVVAFACLSVGT